MPGSLAYELEQRMRAAGFNQRSLAVAAGLNETYVRDLLRGRSRNPKSGHLAKLAETLGCSVSDLAEPGVACYQHQLGPPVYTESEQAVIRMLRAMTPDGVRTALEKLAGIMVEAATPHRNGKQKNI